MEAVTEPSYFGAVDSEDFAQEDPSVTDDSLPDTPEYCYILEAKTVKLAPNMTNIARSTREDRKSQFYMDDRYMSSEEALSLSPNADELNLTDEELDSYDVDDLLEDIQEGEESTKWTRSRSSSKVSVIDCAVAVTIASAGKPRMVDIPASPVVTADVSTAPSIISRQASTISTATDSQYAISRPTSSFSSIRSSVSMITPDSSPEMKQEPTTPAIPLRSRPPLDWTKKPTIIPLPPRSDSIVQDTPRVVPSSTTTPTSTPATVTPLASRSLIPITPTTPVTPTKSSSFFKSVGSKFSTIGKKEKPAPALQISGPFGVTKQPLTGAILAATNGFPISTIVTDLDATRSPTSITTSKAITPVTKLQDEEASTPTKHKRRGSLNLLARSPSSVSTSSISSRPKMMARGATEREPTLVLPPFPGGDDCDDEPKEEEHIVIKRMTVPRKPLPSALARIKTDDKLTSKRKSLLGLGANTMSSSDGIKKSMLDI